MKICIIMTCLIIPSLVQCMDTDLATILKEKFSVSQKQIDRQNGLIQEQTIGVKKYAVVNVYVTKVVKRAIKKACNELKDQLVEADQLDQAARVVFEHALNNQTGIVTKKIRIKRSALETDTIDVSKLAKFYPENLKEQLLGECKNISCPICYNYFKEDFKNPDDTMVDKTVLKCKGGHALCPGDLFSFLTYHYGKPEANDCPICFTPHHYFD